MLVAASGYDPFIFIAARTSLYEYLAVYLVFMNSVNIWVVCTLGLL